MLVQPGRQALKLCLRVLGTEAPAFHSGSEPARGALTCERSARAAGSSAPAPPRARARAGLAPAEVPHKAERAGPHDGEVEDERDDHAEGGPEVVQDVVPLVREHDDDRVQQAQQGQWRKVWHEPCLEERAPRYPEHHKARDDACRKGDPEVDEDGDEDELEDDDDELADVIADDDLKVDGAFASSRSVHKSPTLPPTLPSKLYPPYMKHPCCVF